MLHTGQKNPQTWKLTNFVSLFMNIIRDLFSSSKQTAGTHKCLKPAQILQ